MARDEEAIVQTFRKYVQTFQSLEAPALVPYCQLPCLFISNQGVRVMANAGELQVFIAGLMTSLKARGFSRSEVADMRVNQMSENIALVSVRRIRYKTDGSELERLGETYTFRKIDSDWKVLAALVHDPDVILRTD
jgi:uncharacterized NTF2-like protein DUF6841